MVDPAGAAVRVFMRADVTVLVCCKQNRFAQWKMFLDTVTRVIANICY